MKKMMAILLTAVMTLSMGVVAFGATAYPSDDKIMLNKITEFYMQPYRIDGNNYFKLRAVCGMLQGTVNEFDLNWNSNEGKTIIRRGPLEMPIISMDYDGVFRQTTATPVDAVMEVDGKTVTLKAYNINGYNYFKLRDLADLIGFEVGWDAASKTVNMNAPYGSPQFSPVQKTEVNIEPVQKGPAVRDHEVLVSVKEGQRKVVENTIFNKEVRISFDDYDSVAVFKDCTFNDKISVSGDYDLDKSLIFENCKIKGEITEIPKWK